MISANPQPQRPDIGLGHVFFLYLKARDRLVRMRRMCTVDSHPIFYADDKSPYDKSVYGGAVGLITSMEESLERWAQEVIAHYIREYYPLDEEQIWEEVELCAGTALDRSPELGGRCEEWERDNCGRNNAKRNLEAARDNEIGTLREMLMIPRVPVS